MVNERYLRFSPREAANIQSFPLDFKFAGVSDNRQYRAIIGYTCIDVAHCECVG